MAYDWGTKEKVPRSAEDLSSRLFGLLQLLGEVGTGLELHHLLGSDLDLLAGLGVAALAGGTLADAEGTEADEGNAVTFLQGLRGVVHEGVQGTLGVSLGDLRLGGDRLDQFC